MADFFGYNPPFIGGMQNILSRQEDIRLIKNDILQLLLTIPGERVMRPTFGVHLRNFVFEQSFSSDLSSLKSEIINQIQKEERRVVVESVTITQNPDENSIKIGVATTLKSDPSKEVTVELFLRNPGETGSP